jgi:hypothetical protein
MVGVAARMEIERRVRGDVGPAAGEVKELLIKDRWRETPKTSRRTRWGLAWMTRSTMREETSRGWLQ